MIKTFSKPLLTVFTTVAIISSVAFLPNDTDELYVSDYENVLGTSMEIKIAASSEKEAQAAEEAALSEIDRLNKILSGYNGNSEFSRWMNAEQKPVVVSKELYEVLSLFEQWRLKSNGALDAAAETVGQLWRTTAAQKRLPTTDEIANAVRTIKRQHYVLNKQNGTAQRISEAPLMLNSFAKTYIMNKAADVALAALGVRGVVVNIGGDIIVRGGHTEQIQVSNPKADAENDLPVAEIRVANKAVATSGNYRRGVMIGNKWYSHIVNPRTGLPASEVISATVIADKATDAGALATALNVLSPQEGAALVASVPGAEYLLITADGKRIESKGWKEHSIQPAMTMKPAKNNRGNNQKLWDPKYELAINLELASIEGMRVRRPFVAVWVVDENKKPVRQIALWYNKPRWLNEMRSWYRTYSDQFSAGAGNISSTTGATRSPGKYTLKWDGKDDNGNAVKQGIYTVYIEAAREHGTHGVMSQDFNIKKDKHFDLPGNTEVASASLDYQKKKDGK